MFEIKDEDFCLVHGDRFDVLCKALVRGDRVTTISGTSIEKYRKRFPDVRVMKFCDAKAAQNAFYKKPVREITQADFDHQLQRNPPKNFIKSDQGESFALPQLVTADLAIFFVKTRGHCFTLVDERSLKHRALMDKVAKHIYQRDKHAQARQLVHLTSADVQDSCLKERDVDFFEDTLNCA